MDKIVFLATLAGKLSEYPMSAEEIENSVASVKVFLDRISDVDFAAEPPTDDDAADMAKDLYEKYLESKTADIKEEAPDSEDPPTDAEEISAKESVNEEAPAEEAPVSQEAVTIEDASVSEDSVAVDDIADTEEANESEAEEPYYIDDEPPAPEEILEQLEVAPYNEEAPITSDEDFFEMLAMETETERVDQARVEELELKALAMANKDDPEMVAQVLSQNEKLGEMVANSNLAEEFDPIETAFDPTEHPDMAFEESELTRVFTSDPEASKEFSIDTDKLKKIDEDDSKPKKIKKEKKEKEKVKGTPLFWTLLILTLPITLPLFLTVCALFGVAYTIVTVLIIGCCAAMLSVVVVGTALALIGIIYGIIECFDTVPIGLYEIGVGIIVGGVTMLVSVLLTNLAIRLIPKLYKHIGRIGKNVFGRIGDLYIKIKKECGKKK